jgi:hypothetical protein
MDLSNSALKTAQILICNALLYELEKEREVSRYRFSYSTLAFIANRQRLSPEFLKELDDVLVEFGWSFINMGDSFAVVKTDKVNQWTKLAFKRVQDLVDCSDEEISEKFKELVDNEPDFTADSAN